MIDRAIAVLRPGVTFGPGGSVGLSDDGFGVYISRWDDDRPQPSQGEIDAALHEAAARHVAELIKAERDRRKGAGCPVAGHVFHSDDSSRIQQLGLVMMGASLPAGILWKTADSGFVEMTPALAGQIFAAQATRDTQLFAVAQQHIAGAAAAANPLEYDYSTGWPE